VDTLENARSTPTARADPDTRRQPRSPGKRKRDWRRVSTRSTVFVRFGGRTGHFQHAAQAAFLLIALPLQCEVQSVPAARLPPLSTAAQPAAEILHDTHATALVLVTVRGHDVSIQTFGETAPGSGRQPAATSLVRLCSLSKIFATDLLIGLTLDKAVRLDDPLQLFAPANAHVPTQTLHGPATRPITLRDLATHTAGLPRELGGAPARAPHFTFPDFARRWAWLASQKLLTSPGDAALYSNVGFDLLADALQSAAHEPYPALLAERITAPLGMRDTTFAPTPEQCAQLLRGTHDEGPCADTTASAGSAGLYSTPADMARWLRYLLGDTSLPMQQNPAAQAVYIQPASLAGVQGLDHAGKPSGIGLGWLQLGQTGDPSMILQKTGAGAGFSTYIALNPAMHTGLFLALTVGGGHWHANPFVAANNILLALSNLPPMPVETYTDLPKHARRKPAHRRRPTKVVK
jgi:serine-type D-Ala-D-Ala carboxypeptidase/endopeptidase